jgi:cell division septation protein DedD
MPTVGKAFKAENDLLKDDEILYGVRGTVFLNDQVAVQAAYESSTDNEVGNLGAKTDLERVSANIVYEMNPNKRIRPYGIVGVGNESTHGLTAPSLNQGSQGFVNVGAGLKFGLSKRIDLVTEARWIRKLSNNDDDIIATIGLGINTGSTASNAKSVDKIPSVAATSDVQNAINLAEFRKLSEKKKEQTQPQTQVVEHIATVESAATVVPEESIPANAIILGEDEAVVSIESDVVETVEPLATDNGYYVQMAALFKGKGESLTNRLESKDYHYVLHNVEKRGKEATLILVGPYESRVEANVAKKYLKRLKKDAFIYHVN